MHLRQIPGDEVRLIPPYGLETVALLERQALDTFHAAGIHFDPEPDLFGHSGRPWAPVELDKGTFYVMVEHPASDGKLEIRAPANDVSAELVVRLCEAAGISRRQVLAVASETADHDLMRGER